MKLYKRILLLLLTLCLLLPLSACETRDTGGWGTTAPDGEVTTPEESTTPEEDQTIGVLDDSLEILLNYSQNKKIEFRADPFAQHATLSWMYSLSVCVENEQVSLNGIPYETVTFAENLEWTYDASCLNYCDVSAEEAQQVLKELQRHKGCYVLEPSIQSKLGQKIAVYSIDDTYYLLNFFENGEIMRMHSAKVALDYTPPEEIPPETEPTISFEPISPELEQEILQAYYDLYRYGRYYSYEREELSLRYYGRYGDAYAVRVEGGERVQGVSVSKYEAAGVVFLNPTTAALMLYRKGEFFSIPNAIESALLSEDALQAFHEEHRKQHAELYETYGYLCPSNDPSDYPIFANKYGLYEDVLPLNTTRTQPSQPKVLGIAVETPERVDLSEEFVYFRVYYGNLLFPDKTQPEALSPHDYLSIYAYNIHDRHGVKIMEADDLNDGHFVVEVGYGRNAANRKVSRYFFTHSEIIKVPTEVFTGGSNEIGICIEGIFATYASVSVRYRIENGQVIFEKE